MIDDLLNGVSRRVGRRLRAAAGWLWGAGRGWKRACVVERAAEAFVEEQKKHGRT